MTKDELECLLTDLQYTAGDIEYNNGCPGEELDSCRKKAVDLRKQILDEFDALRKVIAAYPEWVTEGDELFIVAYVCPVCNARHPATWEGVSAPKKFPHLPGCKRLMMEAK